VAQLSKYGAEARTILGLVEKDRSLAARIVDDLPYIMAQVVYSCRREMAMTLADVIERRLYINFEDWDRGYGAAPAVAEVMAAELGWDTGEKDRQVEEYRQSVADELPAEQASHPTKGGQTSPNGQVDKSQHLKGYAQGTSPRP